MAFLTFRGGVHPYDGKELSKEKPITDYAPGKELDLSVIPAHWCSGKTGR